MIGVACQHGADLCALLYSELPACEAEFQSPVHPSISNFLAKLEMMPARRLDAAISSSAVVLDPS